MKNGLSFSQIVTSFLSTSVGCRYFANKLSPHFDAMSLVAQTPWKASVIFSTSKVNITVFDLDGFRTCFSSAASAFEIIELAYTHCALKENFSITLTKKCITGVSLICRELLVRSVAL